MNARSPQSLALIGPPNTTTPAWSSRLAGSLWPRQGRRMSRVKPRLASLTPTRPGVEVSWCTTMRILRIIDAELGSLNKDYIGVGERRAQGGTESYRRGGPVSPAYHDRRTGRWKNS